MARKSEYLQANPVRLDMSRSKFHQSPRWTGTFNAGELVPIYVNTDILPGSTYKFSYASAVRMTTPIRPVMDDLFMDVSFYFVPNDLLLSRAYMSPNLSDSNTSWKAIIGAQDSQLNMPVPASGLKVPYMIVETYDAVADVPLDNVPQYFGLGQLNVEKGAYKINCLAMLGFMAIWNESYREPSTQEPAVFSISSGECFVTWLASKGNSNASKFLGDFKLPNVCRLHSIFGSCLPWPQRNNDGVTIPIDDVPVYASGDLSFDGSLKYKNALQFYNLSGNFDPSQTPGYIPAIRTSSGSTPFSGDVGTVDRASSGGSIVNKITPANLWADMSKAQLYVNTLRASVQAQRWYEALARGGNRLDEMTATMFGVVPKDAGYNRPEYLGGKRVPISVAQVNNTADDTGETGAFSLTNDADYLFTKSFDKHGVLLGCACVRFRDSFSNRIPRQFKRFERFDYYWTQFANLGEEAIYKYELDIGALDKDDFINNSLDGANSDGTPRVFGYQEYAAEYRYPSDIVCGHAAPYADMGYWTYGNFINSDFTLADFLLGNAGSVPSLAIKSNVDRTLKVPSSSAGFQFLAQFQFEIDAVLPMPTHSIPGLVDHH